MSAATARRELWAVAAEITVKWRYRPAAVGPYLKAMGAMRTMADTYPGTGSAPDVVRRFLAVADDWHGADARRLKAELRALLREETA